MVSIPGSSIGSRHWALLLLLPLRRPFLPGTDCDCRCIRLTLPDTSVCYGEEADQRCQFNERAKIEHVIANRQPGHSHHEPKQNGVKRRTQFPKSLQLVVRSADRAVQG